MYWVGQHKDDFGREFWFKWELGNKPVVNEKALHELFNELNKGSAVHTDAKKYTLKGTKGVGKNYLNAAPYGKYGDVKLGDISYSASKLGEGVWLEGINYFPAWKSQGAFIVAVAEPQIMSFYAKKRGEMKEKNFKFISKNIEALETELEYGNIIDLHMHMHNIPYYDIRLVIKVDNKTVHKEEISLARTSENPVLDYNIKQHYELYIKPQWIKTLGHEEGTAKKGELIIQLVPAVVLMHRPYTSEDLKKFEKRITFDLNYKDKWSTDIKEAEWVAQVAKIHEAPLVTQAYEECRYSAIKISDSSSTKDHYILQEAPKKNPSNEVSEPGALKVNHSTPVLEYLAGYRKNIPEVTITLEGLDTDNCVNEMGFDNTETKDGAHTGNVFDISSIEPYEFGKSNIFNSQQPYTEVSKSDSELVMKLAYPYNEFSETWFLLKYLTFFVEPYYVPLRIQTCRYVRTPVIKIHPDNAIAVHFMYDPVEKLYFNNEKVELLSLKANVMSYAKDLVKYLYEPFEGVIKQMGIESDFLTMLDKYVSEPSAMMFFGFHMKADDKVINYATKQPFKTYFYIQMFTISLLPLIFELALAYFTRGKSLQTKIGKAAAEFKNFRKFMNNLGDDLNIEVNYPKVAMNFGTYKKQEAKGKVATIFEFNSQVKPLFGLTTTQVFEKEIPTLGSIKFKAKFKGEIAHDINFKYNNVTESFEVSENFKNKKKAMDIPFKNGDIMRSEASIRCGLSVKLKGKKADKFRVLGLPIPYSASVDAELILDGEIGEETVLGYDKGEEKGPFIQKTYYFTGVKGKYKVEGGLALGPFSFRTTENPEWKEVTVIEPMMWKEPKQYFFAPFRMLANLNKDKNEQNYEYKNPNAPVVNFNTTSK